MEEPLDLSKAKISQETQIYISVVLESIKENYGIEDPESHIKALGFSLEDLKSPKRIEELMSLLNENEK
jgi:hypothetical protein